MRKISRRNFLLASGAVTISAALSACGGSSSSVGAASSAAASSAASDAPAAQGKVLNIWCWNDEFQGRFNNYYPEVASIAEDKSTTTPERWHRCQVDHQRQREQQLPEQAG